MMSKLLVMDRPMNAPMGRRMGVATDAAADGDRITAGAIGRDVEGAEVGRKCNGTGLMHALDSVYGAFS